MSLLFKANIYFFLDSIKDLTDHLIKVHQDAEDDEDADLLRSFTTDSQLAYIFIDVLGGMNVRTADAVKLYSYIIY